MADMHAKELWKHHRGAENGYRFFSDLVAGGMALLPDKQDHIIVNVPEDAATVLRGPYPNFCHPPYCIWPATKFKAEAKKFAERMHSLAVVAQMLADDLENADVGDIKFYVTELPGTRWAPIGEDENP